MTAKKRPTIKGKGADFFFTGKDEKPQTLKPEKATFYLPETLISKLDDVWLDLRRTHKKLRKSDIARMALEELLKDYDKRQQNSIKLSRDLSPVNSLLAPYLSEKNRLYY